MNIHHHSYGERFLRRTISVFIFALVILSSQIALAASSDPSIASISATSGSANQTLNIQGVRFGRKAGKVTFGSRSAKITRWTRTSIDLTVPSGTGTVSVRVTTTNSKKSNTKRFTYTTIVQASNVKVFATNDLGMHCVDQDYSVLSMLPPYNVVNAQVVGQTSTGAPKILDSNSVTLRYSSITDPNGSRNNTSIGKTNFWDYASALFGASLLPGQGLKGLYMPGDAPNETLRSFSWNTNLGLFSAEGIPILPKDDRQVTNFYPMLRVSAFNKQTGGLLGSTDVVLPVSDETTCVTCHTAGARGANRSSVPWVTDPDDEKEARENILILHDFLNGTSLTSSKPVLCASCHYSAALDLAGAGPNSTQRPHNTMSGSMHAFHEDKMLDPSGVAYSDSATQRGGTPAAATRQACYQCHPGVSTKCLRGAMTDTLSCQNCHGGMHAVGGASPLLAGGSIDGTNTGGARRPWMDLPRCQSCHTGDAVNHLTPSSSDQLASDSIRFLFSYNTGDTSASPRLASSSRFAEQPNKLFRHSKGHGGLSCETCHGSTHALWPNGDLNANDNIAATELQGHAGTISECTTCHGKSSLALTMNGPHGMHNVADSRWINENHGHYYEKSPNSCKACHGLTLRGSALSKTFADRTFRAEDIGTKTFRKGTQIGCYDCHNGPHAD